MGANQVKQIEIFLGNQPRLLREMLELALRQFLDNVVIRQINAGSISSVDISQLPVTNKNTRNPETTDSSCQPASSWIVLSTHSSEADLAASVPDADALALISRHPSLQLAVLAEDARTLQVYTPDSGGDVQHTTYTDFSLAQFVGVFQSAA